MTGPREWRHADGCMTLCKVPDCRYCPHCRCGLSAVRDAIAAGHRVVIGPDGVEGRLEWRAHEGARGELAPSFRLTVEDIRTGNVANPNWTTLYRLVPIEETTE